MKFDDIINIDPYSLDCSEKERLLTERLLELTADHQNNCKAYNDILKSIGYERSKIASYKDIPFLPVRLFKEFDLKSVSDDQIVKTMTSSGTSGQQVSKIYLDRTTSANQQKTMVKIVSSFTGSERMPMIIIDCPSVIKNRNMFSARGAGILGFSIFGSKKIYALKDDMTLDIDSVRDFLEIHKGERILLFGFTFMIWQYFYKELLRLKSAGETIDLSNAVLIHGGGWKKLINEAVSPEDFKRSLNEVCGIDRVHDYYGMVEQTGCIYMQCECGHLHSSVFSDVIIRDPIDFSECNVGERGIIQVVSTIPESYPGHSLLTEDEGMILGVDDCPCGRKGKYFNIIGRIKEAEIRGCSDTFAASVSEKNDSGDPEVIVGSLDNIANATNIRPLKPFSDRITEYCNQLSSALMKHPEARLYPDVITLGFWLRKSSILKMKEEFMRDDGNIRLGRGVAFHIAPSNVPVNYAYSLFVGLLCGNANIVRIPSKDFPQVRIINEVISDSLNNNSDLAPYITLVRYERNKEINDRLSSLCDARIIWGGDSTISALRKSPITSRTTEVAFADRYSLVMIDSDEFLQQIQDKEFVTKFSSDFYNDTYLSDQNACTSPRVILWTGNNIEKAKPAFWDIVRERIDSNYVLPPIRSVDKYTELCRVAVAKSENEPKIVNYGDNKIYRVIVNSLDAGLMDYRGNSGYFYEYSCKDMNEVYDICNNTHCQTMAVFGNSSVIMDLLESGIKGIDRIVPIGHTMDFDLIWDGINLVERLTRVINVRS